MGSFTYSELEQAISPGRASRYLGLTVSSVTGQPDPRAAVQLYERNVEISAAAWVVISDIEIVLRNIVADSMTANHAATRTSVNYRWYDYPAWFATGQKWFTSEMLRSIATAMGRVGDPGPTGAPGHPGGPIDARQTLTNAIEMISWANPAAAQWIERRSSLTRAGRWRHLGHSARGIARPSL